MTASIDSERPILASNGGNRASTRLSTYSKATSESSSWAIYDISTPETELKEYRRQVKRMEAEAMERQRYKMSQQKMDEQSKLALVSKVEKSLDRRFTNQDAVMKPKPAKTAEKQ